jgi:hypothetical protein
MVSNNGRIFRIKRNGSLREIKTRIDKDGYRVVTIYLNGKSRYCGVHRYVAKAFVINPDPDNRCEVNHKDGNKLNNYFDNLEWVTPKENIRHAWANHLATAKNGETHPNAKYTNDKVHEVCKHLVENKLTMREISHVTKVSYTVVKQIKSHWLWNEISSQYDFSHYNVNGRKRHFKGTGLND